MKKRVVLLMTVLLILAVLLAGCGSDNSYAEAVKLSFADSASLEVISALNGKQVTITGYMATLSPLDGTYIYLMNMPYQSCPFCVPNTTQLSNTMAVYAQKGVAFDFTDRPIKITGTMKVEDTTDDYGYSYNYRIVDAKYEVVDLSGISQEYALYQSLAEEGVIADVNAMFDYLMFICQWTEYMGSSTDEEGNEYTYYLYPGDVENYLLDEVYGYGTESAEEYFPSLIREVEGVSSEGLVDLVEIIEDAYTVEQQAREQLEGGYYAYDEEADKYTLTQNEELYDRFCEVYLRFSDWLAQYEL